MAFRVGQRVECINDRDGCEGIKCGARYTVTGAGFIGPLGSEHIQIDGHSWWHWSSRFRPVVERSTDISIFTAMLNPSKQTVDAH